MSELLFLAHRFPYPPDKGDKIRSWHFLRHLTERFRVHLGCFIDDERDWGLVGEVKAICGECCIVPLPRRWAKLRSLRGLLTNGPLTLPYYFDRNLSAWTRTILARPNLSTIFVFCSAMAQYIPIEVRRSHRSVADLVDVDSAKWADYARESSSASAWIYRREAKLLRRFEGQISRSFGATIVSTRAEMDLLRTIAPEARDAIMPISNGVDSDYFSPDRHYESPFSSNVVPVVFVGAMDYWPNIDAAVHFALSVVPHLRRGEPRVQFTIVGSNPTAEVTALSTLEGIVVTGRVGDVRPYLAHARAIVAPLRIARGVQNKVLEAMAMARPIIASPQALTGINGISGRDYILAKTDDEFVVQVEAAIRGDYDGEIGRWARERVLAEYSWSSAFARLGGLIDG
jgi:sugar transferase (PEP-CTERM/EpsH1 system associated)